jgi:hypothetical protein
MDNEWKRGRVLVERIMFFLVDMCYVECDKVYCATRISSATFLVHAGQQF